jgi:hypothetical protein
MPITLGVGPTEAYSGSPYISTLPVTLVGVTAGRSLVVIVRWRSATTTLNSVSCNGESNLTLTPVAFNSTYNFRIQIATLDNVTASGDKTITATLSGNSDYVSVVALELAGALTSGMVDVSAQGTSATGVPTVSLVTTVANDALVGAAWTYVSDLAPPAGFTDIPITNGLYYAEGGYLLDAGAPATEVVTFVATTGYPWAANAIALKWSPTVYTMTGSGGVSVTGSATVEFIVPYCFSMTGSGGTTVSGGAMIEFVTPAQFTLVGTGGASVSGAATVEFVNLNSFTGAVNFPLFTATGVVESQFVFTGDWTLPLFSATGSFLSSNAYIGDFRLPLFQNAAILLNGNVYSADWELPFWSQSGVIANPPYVGNFVLPMFIAAGRTDSAIAQTYRGWPVNLKNSALTEYTNFTFNSMTRFNGEYLAAGSGGLFALSGATDDGVEIDARIRFGITDFKIESLKRLEETFVDYRSPGDLLFRVIIDGGYTYTYTLDATGNTGLATNRVKIGKAIEANYFCFEIENVDGTDFDLQNIRVRPVVLSRKIGRPPLSGVFTGRKRLPMFTGVGAF